MLKTIFRVFLLISSHFGFSQYIEIRPVVTSGMQEYRSSDMLIRTSCIKANNWLDSENIFNYNFETASEITHVLLKSNIEGAALKEIDVVANNSQLVKKNIELLQTPINQFFSIEYEAPLNSLSILVNNLYRENENIEISEILFLKKEEKLTALNVACLQGDLKQFIKQIRLVKNRGIDLSSIVLSDGTRLFSYALKTGNSEFIQPLLKNSIDLTTAEVPKNEIKEIDLHLAKVQSNRLNFGAGLDESQIDELNRQSIKKGLNFYPDLIYNQRELLQNNEYEMFHKELYQNVIGLLNRMLEEKMKSNLENSTKYIVALKEQYDNSHGINVQRGFIWAPIQYIKDPSNLAYKQVYDEREKQGIIEFLKIGLLFQILDDKDQIILIREFEGRVYARMLAGKPGDKLGEDYLNAFSRLDTIQFHLENQKSQNFANILANLDQYKLQISIATNLGTLDDLKIKLGLDRLEAEERAKIQNTEILAFLDALDYREQELKNKKLIAYKNAFNLKRDERLNLFYAREKSKKDIANSNGYVYKNPYFWYAMGGYKNQFLASAIFDGNFDQIQRNLIFEKLFCSFVAVLSNRLSSERSKGYSKFTFKNEVLVKETTTYWGLLNMGTKQDYRTDYSNIFVDDRISHIYDKFTKYSSKNGYTNAYGPSIGNPNVGQIMMDIRSGNLTNINEALRYDRGAYSAAVSLIDYFGIGSQGLDQFMENLYRFALELPSIQDSKILPKGAKSSNDDIYPNFDLIPKYLSLGLEIKFSEYGWSSSQNSIQHTFDLSFWSENSPFKLSQDDVDWCICLNNKIETYIPKEVSSKKLKNLDEDLKNLLAEIKQKGTSHELVDFYESYNKNCMNK